MSITPGAAILTLVTSMFTWQGAEGRALECARVLLGGTGLRALGRVVHAPSDGPAFTASYRLVVNEQGVLSRLAVTSATEDRERNLTLNRTEDGYWLLDTGSGSGGSRAEFGGAVDVDVQFSPLFNALPTRRLRLHQEPGEHELPMVFVELPSLRVELVQQCYRTLAPLDADGRATINFSTQGFQADIVVDADGLVLDYPGIGTRL
jgi:uncharacterized protein